MHSVTVDGIELHVLAGDTAGGDVLTVVFDEPISGRLVRITTIDSPSWVAWREIEVLAP